MVGLDLLTPARCGCDQLRERGDDATGRVGVHDELTQDRSKLRLVDVVRFEVVLDLLESKLGDADRRADALQADTAHRRARVRVVSQVVTAAATPIARCRAASSSIHALPGPVSSKVTWLSTVTP